LLGPEGRKAYCHSRNLRLLRAAGFHSSSRVTNMGCTQRVLSLSLSRAECPVCVSPLNSGIR
jgi:hypothetical protein